jgi:hypothetical protein
MTRTPAGRARRGRPAPPRLDLVAAFGNRATADEELLRELQVLVDLGLVEAQPSPEGTRYALTDPITAAADCYPDGASRA